MTTQDSEERRKAVKEAEGLSRMAGSPPSAIVFPLLESYIDGSKTMQEVRMNFEKQFFETLNEAK